MECPSCLRDARPRRGSDSISQSSPLAACLAATSEDLPQYIRGIRPALLSALLRVTVASGRPRRRVLRAEWISRSGNLALLSYLGRLPKVLVSQGCGSDWISPFCHPSECTSCSGGRKPIFAW